LYKLHKMVEKLMPLSIVTRMPDFPLLFSKNHRWGINPIHFNSAVYDYWIKDFLFDTHSSLCDSNRYDLYFAEMQRLNLEDELYSYLNN
jgi:hypothetical protein